MSATDGPTDATERSALDRAVQELRAQIEAAERRGARVDRSWIEREARDIAGRRGSDFARRVILNAGALAMMGGVGGPDGDEVEAELSRIVSEVVRRARAGELPTSTAIDTAIVEAAHASLLNDPARLNDILGSTRADFAPLFQDVEMPRMIGSAQDMLPHLLRVMVESQIPQLYRAPKPGLRPKP